MDKKEKLRAAIKTKDGWWASIFSGPMANRFLEPICDISWVTPNLLTLSSLAIGIAAAWCFAQGDYAFLLIAAVLVQLSFIVDCMDGQLARYRQKFSDFGAWLDRVSDRIKDFLYFFSMAWGFFNLHNEDGLAGMREIELSGVFSWITVKPWQAWPLAMTAFFAVFLIDYYVNQDMKLKPFKAEIVSETTKAGSSASSIAGLLKNFLKSFLKVGLAIYRLVPILRFNIGEQALLISLFAAADAIFPLLLSFSILGIFYVFYWPIAKTYGFTESK